MINVVAVVAALAAQVPDAHSNHPPRITVEKVANGVVGTELFVSVTATDPDGDGITYGAEGLPPGARFEPRTGDVIWTPGPGDIGTHAVTFSASDGQLSSFALTRFVIQARQPLTLSFGGRGEVVAEVGAPFSWSVGVNRVPADLRIDVEGLPHGASFEPTLRLLQWTPVEGDLGDHAIHLVATSKDERAEGTLTVHVRPQHEEWQSYALPGLGSSVYYPVGAPGVGLMAGPSFEVVVTQWVHRNDNVGPSHGRVSLKADLLFPINDPSDPALIYAASLALSLERNPSRHFLLPFFAVDVGGLYQKNLGNAFQVTPALGVHIYESRNIFVSLDVGYLLALPDTEILHGPRATLSGNFTLW